MSHITSALDNATSFGTEDDRLDGGAWQDLTDMFQPEPARGTSLAAALPYVRLFRGEITLRELRDLLMTSDGVQTAEKRGRTTITTLCHRKRATE
jgi:hypothetical protein